MCSEFVNSLARRQHLFNILLPCSCFNFAPNVVVWSARASDYRRRFSSKSVKFYSYKAKAILFGTGRKRDGRRQDRQGTNIMPPVQHKLRRHKKRIKTKLLRTRRRPLLTWEKSWNETWTWHLFKAKQIEVTPLVGSEPHRARESNSVLQDRHSRQHCIVQYVSFRSAFCPTQWI